MLTSAKKVFSSIVLATLTVLQACAVSTQPQQELLTPSVLSQHAPELDELAEGDLVELYTGVLSSLGPVRIGREYTAASGRLCKRIHNASSNQLVSVACRAKKEHWYIRKLVIVGDANGFTSVNKQNISDDRSLLLPQR